MERAFLVQMLKESPKQRTTSARPARAGRVKAGLRGRVDWSKSAAALLRETARPALTAAQSAALLADSRGRH